MGFIIAFSIGLVVVLIGLIIWLIGLRKVKHANDLGLMWIGCIILNVGNLIVVITNTIYKSAIK